MAIIKKSQITNVGKDAEKGNSPTVGGNVNWYSHCEKHYGVLQKYETTI